MATVDFKVKNVKSPTGVTAALAEVSGSIDATSIVQFQNVMDKLVEKGVKNLILDCQNVRYINSTGLGTLLKYVDTFESVGGHMAFVRVPSKVLLVMEMLGFNALFSIVADEQEALTSFGGAPAEAPAPAPAPAPMPTAGPAPAAAPGAVGAPPPASFPITVECSRCRVQLEVGASGKFRCPRCSCILAVEPTGKVRFFASKRIKPVQLTLPCSPDIVGGIGELVGSVAKHAGFNGQTIQEISEAVKSACVNVVERACGSDVSMIFHLIMIPDGEQLTVRISDHGKALDFGAGGIDSDAGFRPAVQTMDTVDLKPNPKGGNILTLTKHVG
jgi:anti-anti-sigma factor